MTLRLDANSGALLPARLLTQHTHDINVLQLHPLRPRVLLSAGADGFARLTDFVSGREVQTPLACQARRADARQ